MTSLNHLKEGHHVERVPLVQTPNGGVALASPEIITEELGTGYLEDYPNDFSDSTPRIFSRIGPDGDSDSLDGAVPHPGRVFAYGRDLETGSVFPEMEIPDVNVYQHKKTLAQGMMDLALFSANANQLRYVLESFNRHPYYYPSLLLISFSLLCQVAIGIGLIWNATYNVKDEKQICIANKINNFTVIGIFLVTVLNVFISAFGVANSP